MVAMLHLLSILSFVPICSAILYMWKQEWTNESSDLSDEFDDFSRIEFNILDYKLINSFQQAIGEVTEKLT